MSDKDIDYGTTLKALVDLRDRSLQKSRIAFSNRLSAIERGVDTPARSAKSVALFQEWFDVLYELETRVTKQIEEEARKTAITLVMADLKGIGLLSAAQVISMIDIERATAVSNLWRYTGYGVKDGKREYPEKGTRLPYNKRLKSTLWKVGGSFLKSKSPYADIYYEAKEYYQTNRTDWTKGHIHNAAMRKMIKLFLQHLWLIWRTMQGLPTNEPYVIAHLGHVDYLLPQDFGWPDPKTL